jgi:hypothetical protein
MMLFVLCIFCYNVLAQCPSGVTISMNFTLDNPTAGVPIPFCTPFRVRTTVKNTTGSPKNLDFIRTSYEPAMFEVVCLEDYATATDCSIPNQTGKGLCINNIGLSPGETKQFSITLRYSTAGLFPSNPLITSRINDILNNCTATVTIPLPISGGTHVLGTTGQTTTYNSLPVSLGQQNRGLLIRGNVILNFDHTQFSPSQLSNFIALDQGANLIIPNGKTLSLLGTNVQGCAAMWNSIIVESGGTLTTNTSGFRTRIRDGMQAIEARDGSNINIFGTAFEDNVRSVYVPPSATGTPQYVNFGSTFQACTFNGTGLLRPTPYSTQCNASRITGFPFAGIDINDLGSLLTVAQSNSRLVKPRFQNMSNGILAKSSRLFVNRAVFENIKNTYSGFDGLGIWSHEPNSLLFVAGDPNPNSNEVEFTNCTQSIVYENFGMNDLAQINSLRIDNTADDIGVGIRAVNNNFNDSYIYANNIRAKIGILSAWNQLNIGEIYNNNIDVTANPTTPWASLGIVGFDNSTTGNWNIYDNFIGVQSGQGGMQFNSGTGATLTNNIITLGTASLSNANGIHTGGSTSFNVSCNDISFPGNPNPFYRSGMYVSNGTGSSYTCNSTSRTEFGFNILGDCQPFNMSGNNFGRHYSGLRLNSGAVIGVQSLRGNTWGLPSSYTTVGAEHLDPMPNNVNLSRFEVGTPGNSSERFPSHSPLGWFSLIGTGIDPNCGSLNACSIATSPNRIATNGSTDESFYTSAMSTARMQTPNAEEMKWTAQRNAYGRLMDNPNHQNNRDKANFVGRMRNTSTGQLYQMEKGLKDARNIGQEFRPILLANANSIKTLANEIAELDVKIFDATGATKAALIAQKKEKNTRMYRLSTENAPRHATIEKRRKQQFQQLMRDNDRISTNLQPEINEKEVNRIYLETVAQGKMELNQEQTVTVRAIAFQCPSKGGNAVFAARSLYALVENVDFKDLELCNARSESVQGMVAKRKEINFNVSPNPATDVLIVSQSSDKVEAGEWLVFDTAGKLLLTKKVSDNEIQASINIQGLSEGIYFASFVVNGEKRFNQKFIKIKSN